MIREILKLVAGLGILSIIRSPVAIFGDAATNVSQEKLTMERIAICTGVEDREPVGIDSTFADTVGTLYCFTEVKGAEEPTTITHVWYHGDEKRAEVSLNIGGPRWRTWSSKRIMKEWTGPWKVEVLSVDGVKLKGIEFEVKESSQ